MELSKNPNFVKALLDSCDAVLTHSIGSHDPLKTILTEEEFVAQLNKIRRCLNEPLIKKSMLLERCRKGDNKAMLELSKISDNGFSNMWLVRAVI